MTDTQQKEYTELKAKEQARKEAARKQGARNRARSKFMADYFKKNATEADKKALADYLAKLA